MAPRIATEDLLRMLGAQRREALVRASLERETPEWLASSRRLNRLNDEIMHFHEPRTWRPSRRDANDRTTGPD